MRPMTGPGQISVIQRCRLDVRFPTNDPTCTDSGAQVFPLRAPQRGAAFALTRASMRARTRSIGSRSRARGLSLIFEHPPPSLRRSHRLSAAAGNFSEAPLRRANRLHRSLGRQDNADALALLKGLVALPNASVTAYQLLANTLELTIDCFWAEEPAATAAEALAVSQKAVQLAPLDYLSNYVLGRALLHSGRHDLAIAAARRSVELNPNSGTSWGGLGGVLAFAGDPEEATAISERGFQLSPPEPYTALWIWYAAVAAFRLQQFDLALRHAEAGILVKPDVATGHLLRAIACSGLSRLTDAKESVHEASAWNPSLSLAHIAECMPYRHRTDLEKAIDALRAAGMRP